MFDTREKKERSVGTRLFLKPFRSQSPKSAMVRRPQRPGMHGKAHRRAPSEYSLQLSEKQKIKYTYGLREAQLRNTFKKAMKSPATTGPLFMALLERRLDSALFRLGFAPSRSVARQLIGHGHIRVNGKRVKAPSFEVRPKDIISIRPESKNHPVFKDLAERLVKAEVPAWLAVDAVKIEGKVTALPYDFEMPFDIGLVVDYYSKIVK